MGLRNAKLRKLVGVTSNDVKRFKAILALLPDYEGRINAVNEDGDTPLHIAIESAPGYSYFALPNRQKIRRRLLCSDGLVEMLLFEGADPNLVNNRGHTPLQLLVRCGCIVPNARTFTYTKFSPH